MEAEAPEAPEVAAAAAAAAVAPSLQLTATAPSSPIDWRELPPLGNRIAMDNPFRNVMTFSSIVRLKDGSSLGLFHRGDGLGEGGTLQVMQSITRDGGFTWSQPVVVADGHAIAPKLPCEPYVFRSPDGDELCCIMRENKRTGTSLVMFSRDEGKTWSQPVDTVLPVFLVVLDLILHVLLFRQPIIARRVLRRPARYHGDVRWS